MRDWIVCRFAIACISLALLTACTPPYLASNPYPFSQPYRTGYPNGLPPLAFPGQTVGLESADRIARFRRLAAIGGVTAPAVTEQLSTAGAGRGPPVVRVVYDERAFFDSGSETPRPEATRILDLVAENMRRDVPDAQLTLLGHTDAVGTDAYNDDLSLRRARAVFGGLVRRGMNAGQLSTVAIGKRHPIAPNDTESGRARNRRVEFLISASTEANMSVVGQTRINGAWLRTSPDAPIPAPAAPERLAVLRPAPKPGTGPADISEAPLLLQEAGQVELQPMSTQSPPVRRATRAPEAVPATAEPTVASPMPVREPTINAPTDIQMAPLGPDKAY